MALLNKFIAWLCAILFVISGVVALLLFNVERKAFYSATYKHAFANQNLYERTPEILANALYTANAGNANVNPYLKTLTIADWQMTITSLLPPEELKAVTDNAIDSVFDYLNSKTNSAAISLRPFKANLIGPSGVAAITQILHAQPECTAEQLMQLGLGLLGGEVGLCNPPAELMGLITPLIESQLQVLMATFPDEITIIAGTRSGTPDDPRIKLDRVRALMKVTPFFPLFFLFGISVFAIRSLMDWLKWWGYPFLITGTISALMALVGSPLLGFIVQRLLQKHGAGSMPPILFSTLRVTVSAVTTQILRPVAIEGAILAVLGLIMVLVATFLVRR
jgi:hypothetical protein